jgi:hypothetical protein
MLPLHTNHGTLLGSYRLMSIGVGLPGRLLLISRSWLYFVGFGMAMDGILIRSVCNQHVP